MKLKDEALQYARAGWPIVPLVPGKKSTLVPWTEFQERNATEYEVEGWWDRWPNANIGAVTGRSFVVVDVDVWKGGDPKPIWDKYPTSMIVQSARGGFHLYYELPEDPDEFAGNRVSAFTGVDFRGHGGIIALPPSVFEGKQYKWLQVGSCGRFPTGLFTPVDSAGESDKPKWVTDALGGVGEGERNDTCAHLAGYFLGKEIPADIVQSLLMDWNRKNEPPMPETEIATTVASVARKIFRKIQKTPKSALGLKPGERVFKTVPINEFLRDYGVKAQTWLIDDWLPDQSIVMIVAPPGSYKTWMTYDLAVSLTTQTDFLGAFGVNRKCKVMIAQQEDSLSGQAARQAEIICSKLGIRMPEDTDGEFLFPGIPTLDIDIHPYRMLRFDDELIMLDFERKIAASRPDVIILDPLYSLAATDDYMVKISEHMMKLKALRDKYGCSFLLVHHSKKNAKDDGREAAWGSQFVNASREGGWHITKPSEEHSTIINVTRFFKDGEEFPPLRIEFDIQTRVVPHKYEVIVYNGVADLSDVPTVEGMISNNIA